MASSSIVYLFSQPLVNRNEDVELEVLDCSTEREIIKDVIKNSDRRSIRFRSCCATIANVDKLFKNENTVVHFAAHGSEDRKQGITFESSKGEAVVPTIEDLRKFIPISGEKDRIKILFVSACHSEASGKAFEEANAARHIVAVNQRISDKMSEHFTKSFYQALFAGSNVQKAFENAKLATIIDDPQSSTSSGRSAAASMFLLLPRDHTCTQDCCYFPRQLIGTGTTDIVDSITRNYCVALLPEKKFVGRCRPMQIIYSYLVDNHCVVTVTGVFE